MGEQYDVDANLRLRTEGAVSSSRALSNSLHDLGRRIQGTQNMAGSMVRQLIAVGGAYLGVRAVGGAFVAVTGSAFKFRAEIEKTKISLAAILSTVEGTSFAAGLETSGKVFKELTNDAIKSVATTQELFGIYQMIVGPIRAAGQGLSVVREMTNSTVAAATALNIDLPQASRDITSMVRGTAGVDVKMFSILRSVGQIKEDAEQWNKGLTQGERIEKLRKALAAFNPAAEAYGKSWAGVTSTLKDVLDQFKATAIGPAFESIKRFIDGINTRLIENRERITGYLEAFGIRFGHTVDRVLARAENAFQYVYTHWDEILAKINAVVAKARELAPILAKAAAAWAAISVARQVVGVGLGAASMGAQALEITRGMMPAKAAGAATAGVQSMFQSRAAMMADFMVPGAAAAGIGGGGAAAAGVGAGGAGAAGAGTAMAGLIAALPVLAGVLAAVAGVVLVVREQWDNLVRIFGASTEGLLGDVVGLATAIGMFLAPFLKIAGHLILGPLVLGFTLLMPLLRTVIFGWQQIFEVLSMLTNYLYDLVKPAFDWFYGMLAQLAEWFNNAGQTIAGMLNLGGTGERQSQRGTEAGRRAAEQKAARELFKGEGFMASIIPKQFSMLPDDAYKDKTPPAPVYDFKGAKIEVKQVFKEADPDRVLITMIDDLHRQAEMRVRSGYAPALSG